CSTGRATPAGRSNVEACCCAPSFVIVLFFYASDRTLFMQVSIARSSSRETGSGGGERVRKGRDRHAPHILAPYLLGTRTNVPTPSLFKFSTTTREACPFPSMMNVTPLNPTAFSPAVS